MSDPSADQSLPAATEDGRQEARCNFANSYLVGLACPVREDDDCVAALGLFLPEHRFRNKHREAVENGLKRAAGAVSERISRSRPTAHG